MFFSEIEENCNVNVHESRLCDGFIKIYRVSMSSDVFKTFLIAIYALNSLLVYIVESAD